MLFAMGCGAPTSIRVKLAYDESWGLNQITLSIADQNETTDIEPEFQLLIPNELAGETQTLKIVAFRAGQRFAYGEADVVPRLGEEVEIFIVLTRLPCGAWCTEGETECRDDGIVICEQRDEDHCFEWSERVPCPQDAPHCSFGRCASDCIDECAKDERQCSGPHALRICGQADSDPCLEWLENISCEEGEICSAGRCSSECSDECTPGDVRCLGGGQQRCGDQNRDGCTEWSPRVSCPENQSCDQGVCIEREECRDECSGPQCSESVFLECGQFDRDPCLDISQGISCAPRDSCMESQCTLDGCSSIPKSCSAPEAPICVNSNRLRIYDNEGWCSEGECQYTAREVDCPNCSVSDGIPNCDPCRGVVCNQPPEPSTCYQPLGSCEEGSCSYDYVQGASCDDGDSCTDNDICSSGNCSGTPIECDVPPEPICADEHTLRIFIAGGICSGGACRFSYGDSNCGAGCDETGGAHCVDPCAGVVCEHPPSPSECYQTTGVCQDGLCTYSYADGATCDDGNPCTNEDRCSSGICQGSGTCSNDPPSGESVTGSPLTGRSVSIAVDSNDRPHISYFVSEVGDLQYAYWDAETQRWRRQTVDAENSVGWGSSIALDRENHPRISYRDSTNDDLKYAQWDGSRWNTQRIAGSGNTGGSTSLGLDSEDYPHIAYQKDSSTLNERELRYATWNGSEWLIRVVDTLGGSGSRASLAVDRNDQIHMSHQADVRGSSGFTNGRLRYAFGNIEDGFGLQTVHRPPSWHSSSGSGAALAVDEGNRAHIIHGAGGSTFHEHWNETMWVREELPYTRGQYSSFTLDQDGHPHICFWRWRGSVPSLYHLYSDGSEWTEERIPVSGETGDETTGWDTDIAIDSLNRMHIAVGHRGILRYILIPL